MRILKINFKLELPKKCSDNNNGARGGNGFRVIAHQLTRSMRTLANAQQWIAKITIYFSPSLLNSLRKLVI